MITLRLDPDLEEAVTKTAKNLGLTKSDLIRQSLVEYLDKIGTPNAWDVGRDLFGKYASGKGNLSVERKKIFKSKIKSKRG
jgi:hypothetical protein